MDENKHLLHQEGNNVIEIGLLTSKNYPFNIGEVIRFQRSNLWYKIIGKKPIPNRDGWSNVKLERIYSVEGKVDYNM